MITNKSYDIHKYQKWLSQAESSVTTAQQEFYTAKQKLDRCIADRNHVQSALNDQQRAEDLIMSIVGNVSSDATLDGVSISKQANNNVDHCKAYFTASNEFVNELVNKLSAEEIKPGVYRGSYNGCSFRITSDGSDVYLTIQNFSTLLSATNTNESIKESMEGSYELDQTYNLYDWVSLRDGRNVIIIDFENYEYIGLSEVSVFLNKYEPIRFFETDIDYSIENSAITKWTNRAKELVSNFEHDDFIPSKDVMEALNIAHELDEQTNFLRLSAQQKRDICSAIDNCFNGITVVNRHTKDVEKLDVESSYKDGKNYGDRYRYRFTLLPTYVNFSFIQNLDDSQNSRASELKNKLESILAGMSFTVKSSSVLSGTNSYSKRYPVIEIWVEM